VERNRLLIVGAGDFAREVLWCAEEIPAHRRDWDIGGFLDDRPEEAQARMRDSGVSVPVLGKIGDYQPQVHDRFICAIGAPQTKLMVCETLAERGAVFVNLVHPTAAVGPRSHLGHGVIMWRYATVSTNVVIGNFVTLNCYASVGHDAVVEDGCTLSAHCDVTGHAHLGRGVFMGTHAAILPGARIGSFSTVGAGSIVLRRVAEGLTVLGVPAKPI
jgi:sugar O-acyltransferase (sialic acid O-acetyltransferase NeuD family)